MRKLDFKIRFAANAVSLTNVPSSFSALSRQRMRWSKSLIRFRLRKHHDIYLPQANFSFINFFALWENIFYNLILDFFWWIYAINLLATNFDFLLFLIPLKFIIYGIGSIFSLLWQ
jgi:cellulose synthase/poly-beta-1,6-N-acetylglucosamine synthase-like glycosyltransferase